jgi:hypothetical protein
VCPVDLGTGWRQCHHRRGYQFGDGEFMRLIAGTSRPFLDFFGIDLEGEEPGA